MIINNSILDFSPTGWDNEKKISILYENMHSVKPGQYYTDVIARPIVRKVSHYKILKQSRLLKY